MYKIGDKIGHHTMDGIYLCEIVDIININSKDLGEVCLTVKRLYDDDLKEPFTNTIKSIILPQQRYEVLTKEEYIEMIQNDINKRQNILNKIKEEQ